MRVALFINQSVIINPKVTKGSAIDTERFILRVNCERKCCILLISLNCNKHSQKKQTARENNARCLENETAFRGQSFLGYQDRTTEEHRPACYNFERVLAAILNGGCTSSFQNNSLS